MLKNTYRTPAILGYTDWEIAEGLATGAPGAVYYSKITTVLEQSPRGTLVIRRDTGSGKLPSSTVTAAFPARGRTPRCARSP